MCSGGERENGLCGGFFEGDGQGERRKYLIFNDAKAIQNKQLAISDAVERGFYQASCRLHTCEAFVYGCFPLHQKFLKVVHKLFTTLPCLICAAA